MQTITIPKGSLLILSGVPGSGKSTLLANSNFSRAQCVSMDDFRDMIFEPHLEMLNGTVIYARSADAQIEAAEMASLKLTARMREGLTTVVDSTNLTDSDRLQWAKIAQKFNRKVLVAIFAISHQKASENNLNRRYPVSQQVIDSMIERLVLSSELPYVLISEQMVADGLEITVSDQAESVPRSSDVVGDVHGNWEALKALLEKAGWSVSEATASHPENRKLIFLGDLVDRGPESMRVLRFVRALTQQGIAKCLKGNHEAKLVKFAKATGADRSRWTSLANLESGVELLKLKEAEREQLLTWMDTLPFSLSITESNKTVLLAHGDVAWFSEGESLGYSECVYGSSRLRERNSDAEFSALSKKTFELTGHKHYLVHGHIACRDVNDEVLSLETGAEHGGLMSLVRLESVLAGKPELIQVPSALHYDRRAETRFGLLKQLNRLVAKKLAVKKVTEDGLLQVYKYSKSVFYQV